MTADQDVFNTMNGTNGTAALPEALVARFYNANMFGLSKDYAYPEGSNVTSSRYDSITSMDKLLTRKRKHVDGNSYDAWDCLQTIVKSILAVNPHINDDEKNSVNYKLPTT